jgi:hypothetical protein
MLLYHSRNCEGAYRRHRDGQHGREAHAAPFQKSVPNPTDTERRPSEQCGYCNDRC